jgi:hypothetical protein
MTRIPIKEEDIEIIKREFDTHDSDGNDRIGYEYYLKISDTPYMEKQEAEALKQQLLDDHEKARERDFYKEVADERKEVVEKLEQQVKKLQEEKIVLEFKLDVLEEENQNFKAQLQKYKEKYGDVER